MGVIQNVWENMGFVIFFILVSGYFATTAWFGVIRRRRSVVGQSWVNVLLFCAHAGVFLVIIRVQVEHTVGMLVLGVGAVAFASLIGGSLRALGSKPTRKP